MTQWSFGGANNFQLFCLFNRFCEPHGLPLKIPPKQLGFLLGKLNVQLDDYRELTLQELISILESKPINLGLVQKLFDETVLDIVMQGDLKAKICPQG